MKPIDFFIIYRLIEVAIFIGIILLMRTYYRRAYLGKPMKVKYGQRFKFWSIISEEGGKIIFFAEPLFGKTRRSMRIMSIDKSDKNWTMEHEQNYVIDKTKKGHLFIRGDTIVRKFKSNRFGEEILQSTFKN